MSARRHFNFSSFSEHGVALSQKTFPCCAGCGIDGFARALSFSFVFCETNVFVVDENKSLRIKANGRSYTLVSRWLRRHSPPCHVIAIKSFTTDSHWGRRTHKKSKIRCATSNVHFTYTKVLLPCSYRSSIPCQQNLWQHRNEHSF